jgi:hypothetical protein
MKVKTNLRAGSLVLRAPTLAYTVSSPITKPILIVYRSWVKLPIV